MQSNWRSALVAPVALAVLSACGDGDVEGRAAPARSLGPEPIAASALRLDTLATGLNTPWGLAVAADGRTFVTERTGCLKAITPSGAGSTLRCLEVYAEDSNWHPESGLMGIALDPDFANNGRLFLYATVHRDSAPPSPSLLFRIGRRLGLVDDGPESLAFENRIVRARVDGDSLRDVNTIVSGIPASHYHAGGALAVGPDGMLYASIGDARLTASAQDPNALIGKILRYRLDGSIPSDNPIPGSPVWAWGLRNPQGFAWLSDSTLIAIEHGPSGLDVEGNRVGRDELNVIVRGGNYGWPLVAGLDSMRGSAIAAAEPMLSPIRVWSEAVAPAGLAYAGTGAILGTEVLLVGRLRGGIERLELRRVQGEWRVTRSELFALPALRRVRSVHSDGAGSWLVSTSNVGIRGTNLGSDDLLLRLRLPAAAHAR